MRRRIDYLAMAAIMLLGVSCSTLSPTGTSGASFEEVTKRLVVALKRDVACNTPYKVVVGPESTPVRSCRPEEITQAEIDAVAMQLLVKSWDSMDAVCRLAPPECRRRKIIDVEIIRIECVRNVLSVTARFTFECVR